MLPRPRRRAKFTEVFQGMSRIKNKLDYKDRKVFTMNLPGASSGVSKNNRLKFSAMNG